MDAKTVLAKCFCAVLFSLSFWLFPAVVGSEIYQWTDDRGVIHFTDSLQSVPADVRGSPDLIIRSDIKEERFEVPATPVSTAEERTPEPETREAAIPSEPDRGTVTPPVVHVDSQTFNIIVNNTRIRRHPGKKKRCLIPEGCRPRFQPRFHDRRYIHPSVFNGGSRQYIRPKLFPRR